VVQSAYRSFFTGARAGRYSLRRSGDLWRLLAAITLHKVQRQVEHHTAGKRAAGRKLPLAEESGSFGPPDEALAREPTPEEAAALTDTLERMFRGLEPLQRRMVELRLQGCALDEIAADVQRSERTVRRLLELMKLRLRQECLSGGRKDEE
jgi:DNA-directed RNA polymerase specialized sigma24 family protein